MEQICILKQKIYNYPDKKGLFRPASAYPEYIFKEESQVRITRYMIWYGRDLRCWDLIKTILV